MRPLIILLLLAAAPSISVGSVISSDPPLVLKAEKKEVSAYVQMPVPMANSPLIGNLDTYNKGIAAGTVKVVFLGDSITEGLSQIRYKDSWAGKLSETLRQTRPDVQFEFANLSLPGRGIAQVTNPNYRAAPADDPAIGFHRDPSNSGIADQWPTGSKDGLSWIDQVKAEKPDLVILAFGMNDRGSSGDIARLTRQALKSFEGFEKQPSVALVTPILPSRKIKPFDDLQDVVQLTADVYRSLSVELGLTLLDANWRYRLLRDGEDLNAWQIVPFGLEGYPTNFRKRSGYGFELQGGLLYGYGAIEHLVSMSDIQVTSSFILNDYREQTPSVWYRVDRQDSMKSYRLQIAMGDEAILFYGMTPIASGKIDSLHNGQKVTIKIKAIGGRHVVWVNGSQVIDVWDYKSFSKGSVVLQTDEGPMGGILDYSLSEYVNVPAYSTTYTEDQLLGVNDFNKNPDSVGGNAINHPSKLGHTAVYLEAMWPLIEVTKAVEAR